MVLSPLLEPSNGSMKLTGTLLTNGDPSLLMVKLVVMLKKEETSPSQLFTVLVIWLPNGEDPKPTTLSPTGSLVSNSDFLIQAISYYLDNSQNYLKYLFYVLLYNN